MFPLDRMLLILPKSVSAYRKREQNTHPESWVTVFRIRAVKYVRADKFLMLLDAFLVHDIQALHTELDVADQGVAPALAEILADNHPKHFHFVRVRRHRVCRDNSTASTKPVGDRELIILAVLLGL